jgi:hypothetical protein
MRDEGDRFVAWRLDDALATPGTDVEEERMERALLAYAQRSAARVGAEWFAAEFARRDEEERVQESRGVERLEALNESVPDPAPAITLIDASVENAVIGGAPTGLGLQRAPQSAPLPVRPATPQAAPPEPSAPEPVAVEAVATQPGTSLPAAPEQAMALAVTPQATPAQPTVRHPHVPRPPAPEPASGSKRRRRRRQRVEASAPSFVISAPEWARMSPGARRLYGLDASPHAAG